MMVDAMVADHIRTGSVVITADEAEIPDRKTPTDAPKRIQLRGNVQITTPIHVEGATLMRGTVKVRLPEGNARAEDLATPGSGGRGK